MTGQQTDYYFSKGDEEFGPFTASELRRFAASGEIGPDDRVWVGASGKKMRAAAVKGLFAKPAGPKPKPSQRRARVPADRPAAAARGEQKRPNSAPLFEIEAPPARQSQVWSHAAKWMERLKREVVETVHATWHQFRRAFYWVTVRWKRRQLEKDVRSQLVLLGGKLCEAKLGDANLRKRVSDLQMRITAERAADRPTGSLEGEHHNALAELAEQYVRSVQAGEENPSSEIKWAIEKISFTRSEADDRSDRAKEADATFFPTDSATRVRVCLGIAVLLLFVYLVWPKGPSQTPFSQFGFTLPPSVQQFQEQRQQEQEERQEAVAKALAEGIELVKRGSFAEALTKYDEALRHDPRAAEIYNAKGLAQLVIGQRDGAIDSFGKATQYDRDLVEAYVNRAKARSSDNDSPRGRRSSISDWSRVIELESGNASHYNERGLAYVSDEKYDKALADFTSAVKLDPKFVDAYVNRANTHRQQENHRAAVDDYMAALELGGESANLFYQRGLAYSKSGDTAQALNDFNQAIRLDRALVDAYLARGYLQASAGRHEEAASDFATAISSGKADPQLYVARATSLMQLRQYQQAAQDYTWAIELDSKLAAAYQGRAEAKKLLGDGTSDQDLAMANRLSGRTRRVRQIPWSSTSLFQPSQSYYNADYFDRRSAGYMQQARQDAAQASEMAMRRYREKMALQGYTW